MKLQQVVYDAHELTMSLNPCIHTRLLATAHQVYVNFFNFCTSLSKSRVCELVTLSIVTLAYARVCNWTKVAHTGLATWPSSVCERASLL